MADNKQENLDEVIMEYDESEEFEDMEEMDDFEDDTIVLTDEDGNDVEFEFLDFIEYEEKEYAVLLPKDSEDGMVVIMLVEESDDDEDEITSLTTVEDEAVLSAVYDIFKEKFKDEIDFED